MRRRGSGTVTHARTHFAEIGAPAANRWRLQIADGRCANVAVNPAEANHHSAVQWCRFLGLDRGFDRRFLCWYRGDTFGGLSSPWNDGERNDGAGDQEDC